MRDKVTRQCPQTTTFEEKGEPKRLRTEVPVLSTIYQPNALPLGQTGSHQCLEFEAGYILLVSLTRHQELRESRGGRPGLSVLMSLMVSVDIKQH